MKRVLEGVEAVLFDLDGTLVETNIDFPRMKREMLALADECGVDSEAARSLDILGVVTRIEESLQAQGNAELARKAREKAMRRLEEIELAHSETAQEIASARDLIELLRSRGIKVGIVTRNCRRASELSLRVAGLDTGLLLLAREDTPKTKPHPDHLLTALDRLGARPDRSVMVGDHLMDVAAGKAAGMRTIAFLAPERPRDFFDAAGPDAVAISLREIIDAFSHLHS